MKVFETSFPRDFRTEEIKEILNYATSGKSCQLVCIPGSGKATILRLIAHNPEIIRFHLRDKSKQFNFVYVNLLENYEFSDLQIFKFLLLCLNEKPQNTEDSLILQKQLLESIGNVFQKDISLVLLFDHFDEFQNKLNRSFFQLLKSANSLAKYKFSAVFGTRRDLNELIDDGIRRDYWEFFTDNSIHFKVYDPKAAEFLFFQIENTASRKLESEQKKHILEITGGHAKLTKILSEKVLKEENFSLETSNLLNNQNIRAALYELWLFLTSEEQQELYLLSQKRQHEQLGKTQSLIKFDLIAENHKFTIPLFEAFVSTQGESVLHQKFTVEEETGEIKRGQDVITELLSPQEYRLLKFMISKENKIVSRDEIINAVWHKTEATEAISDEAIDQMIFRLRKKIENDPKNPAHLLTVKGHGFKFEA